MTTPNGGPRGTSGGGTYGELRPLLPSGPPLPSAAAGAAESSARSLEIMSSPSLGMVGSSSADSVGAYGGDSNMHGLSSVATIKTSHKDPTRRQRLAAQPEGDDPEQQQQQPERRLGTGTGTVRQTSLNIAKTCMGTGTLALPYAACRGGLLFNVIGLGLVSLWNLYSVDRLLRCLDLIPQPEDEGGYEGNGAGAGAGGGSAIERRPSRCSRHRRTGSSMRKLFRRMISDRVVIQIEADDDEVGLAGPTPMPEANGLTAGVGATKPVPSWANDRPADGGGGHPLMGEGGRTAAGGGPDPGRATAVGRPPPGTATYGRVAFHAFGPLGLRFLDLIMTVLLLGIIVAYEDAVVSFLGPTPLSTGRPGLDALVAGLVIFPLSCVTDMGRLSRLSASGIAAVLGTFAVVFWHGVAENGAEGISMVGWSDLWPTGGTWGVRGLSGWFGVAVFGYGIVPIAYNVQEGMSDPSQMSRATEAALGLVYLSYVVIGDGVAVLYRPATGPDGFQGDVLQELPAGWIPTLVRVAMTFVVVVSAPLLVVPCAELLEGKMGLSGGAGAEGGSAGSNRIRAVRAAVRLGICLLCTGISVLVPGFVNVLSFVGAFCVALTSFVFPPLLHLALLQKRARAEAGGARCSSGGGGSGGGAEDAPVFKADDATRMELMRFEGSPNDRADRSGDAAAAAIGSGVEHRRIIFVDGFLLVWGILATAVTSFLTFTEMLEQSRIMRADGSR